jgi:hypothetical protein
MSVSASKIKTNLPEALAALTLRDWFASQALIALATNAHILPEKIEKAV